MKRLTHFLFLYFIISFVSHSTLFAQTSNKKTNILIILADDLGYKDLGCYGSSFYETPNLDALAKDGVKFTNGYAASPVCSPTRAALLTGKYPTKTGVTDWITGRQANGKAKPYEKLIASETGYQLNLNENTFAEFALSKGYNTFIAGKWHLGEDEKYWPQHQGFTINKGGFAAGSPKGKINDSTGAFFTPYKNPMLPDGPKGEYLTDRLTNECIDFINNNKNKPFVMFHSMYAVHNPLQAPKNLIEKYKQKKQKLHVNEDERFSKKEAWTKNEKEWKTRLIQDNPAYAAMIENMDWNIGRIIDALKMNGLYENTLIIFTSDNGGLSTAEGSPTSLLPLRGGKGWMYEGGIKVPFILKFGNKTSSNKIIDAPVNSIDIYPTIAKAIDANYKINSIIDGIDIMQIIKNSKNYYSRNLIWHYPHYSNQGGKPAAAIREGKYKLIYFYEDKKYELYDIEKDIAEENDLIIVNKNIANTLKLKLTNWIKLNAKDNFKPNPNYAEEK
jgi:arylsulfatase A-like enzyme